MTRAFPRRADTELSPLGRAGELCIGCYAKDGEIIPDLSPVKVCDCPQNVYAGFYAESAGRYVLCADDGIYLLREDRTVKTENGYKPAKPFCFRTGGASPVWYIAGDGKCMSVASSSHALQKLSYGIFGGVNKNGRLFCIDASQKSMLRWSGAGGGTDWQENVSGAGWLYVNKDMGDILNLVIFKQRVAVVCEAGIVLLSAYGTPENFKLTYLDGKTGVILPDTCAEVGGMLVFFTQDGLFCYNGVTVQKLKIGIADDIVNPSGAISFDGRYFVLGESKTLKRRVVFVLRAGDRCGYIVDLPATALLVKDCVECVTPQGIFALKAGGEYTYSCDKISFGAGVNCLKSVHLGNGSPVTVSVESYGISRIVAGVSGYCRVNVRGSGFKLSITGTDKISGVKLVAEVVNDV